MLRENKDLTELPGIGTAIAKKVEVIIQTGKLPQLEEEEKHVPRIPFFHYELSRPLEKHRKMILIER